MTVRKEDAEPEIPVYNIDEVQPQMVQVDGDALEGDEPTPPIGNAAVPIANAVPIPPPSPAFKGPETIDVIAPTNMAEGYQFNVDAAGRMLRVQVPPGGVVAGQRFGAIVLQQDGHYNSNTATAGNSNVVPDPHMIPRGRWRDDLCDCCRFGCCHPMCCLACWCAPCALGQVMTRFKLNWCGELMNGPTVPKTFKILAIMTGIYVIFNWVTGAIISGNDEDGDEYNTTGNEEEGVVIVSIVSDLVDLAFGLFVLFITIRTRGFIRRKYGIPTKCCGNCEDCCCSFWCNPCTVCQMARHTANYELYSAACCSDTGLAVGVPEVV